MEKLTKQEEKFAEKVLETGNLTQAVQESFKIEDPNYAGVKGHRLIRKDKIINAIEVKRKTLKEALIEKGITEDKIADKINTLLDAKIGENEKPDINAIDKGLKHATNIYGVIDTDDKPKTNSTYNFIFNAETQKSVNEINEIIKAKLINNEPI